MKKNKVLIQLTESITGTVMLFSYSSNGQLYTVYQEVVFNVNDVKYCFFFVSLNTTYIQWVNIVIIVIVERLT